MGVRVWAGWREAVPDWRSTIGDQEGFQQRMDFDLQELRPRAAGVVPRSLARELAQELGLERPLVALDLESTGLDPRADRIVEISLARIEPGGDVESLNTLVFPGLPMPPGAERIHGISDADVAEAPTFADVAAKVARLLRGADLAGYNLLRFDLPLLSAELNRAGLSLEREGRRIVDACAVFKRKERRNLAAAYRFYCGRDLRDPHTAAGDVIATLEVLAGQLRRYSDLPRDVDGLDWFARRRQRPSLSS